MALACVRTRPCNYRAIYRKAGAKMKTMTEAEAEDLYNDYLDELGLDELNLPSASVVLKEVDPTAYGCGFADWCDANGIEVE